jgi:CRP-like cAMP-binding protein
VPGSTSADRITELRRIPLFQDLTQDDLALIAQVVTGRSVPEGTVITRQGDAGSEAMIILSGTALVERDGRVIDEMQRGDFFGEMSLMHDAPRSATVVATSEMDLLTMSSDDFCSMLEENPTVSVRVLRMVAARVAASTDSGTI